MLSVGVFACSLARKMHRCSSSFKKVCSASMECTPGGVGGRLLALTSVRPGSRQGGFCIYKGTKVRSMFPEPPEENAFSTLSSGIGSVP